MTRYASTVNTQRGRLSIGVIAMADGNACVGMPHMLAAPMAMFREWERAFELERTYMGNFLTPHGYRIVLAGYESDSAAPNTMSDIVDACAQVEPPSREAQVAESVLAREADEIARQYRAFMR